MGVSDGFDMTEEEKMNLFESAIIDAVEIDTEKKSDIQIRKEKILEDIRKRCNVILSEMEDIYDPQLHNKLLSESKGLWKASVRYKELIPDWKEDFKTATVDARSTLEPKDISVVGEGNGIIIDIPARLQKRDEVKDYPFYAEWLRLPLRYVLERFIENEGGRKWKISSGRAGILIVSAYEDRTRICDYDNLDTHELINAIADYLLVDDDPENCILSQDYEMDDREHTIVYILPENEYYDFLSYRAKMQTAR